MHIDVKYHWIQDVSDYKELIIEKIHIDNNGADMMTKSLPKEKIEFYKREAEIVVEHSKRGQVVDFLDSIHLVTLLRYFLIS
jgi:lipopolysaccharide biosynthesis glycosyltransferase